MFQCELKYDNVEQMDCQMIEEEKCESKYETIYDTKCDTVYEPKVRTGDRLQFWLIFEIYL